MAASVARNLKDDIMVVLAGSGHVIHKFGIPDRAFRRTDAPFRSIMLTSAERRADLSLADYLWVTPATNNRKPDCPRVSEKSEKRMLP